MRHQDVPVLCGICGKEICKAHEKLEFIALEANTCGPDASYKCNTCQEIESTEPSDMGYICSFCGHGFAILSELQDHMVTHNVTTD